jgi:hypothetical protein
MDPLLACFLKERKPRLKGSPRCHKLEEDVWGKILSIGFLLTGRL